MFKAADGQDGNGFHLEKIGLIVYEFTASVLENSLRRLLWFIFSSKSHLISSFWCSINKYFMYDKGT